MLLYIFSKHRVLGGQEVQEPTLLWFALVVVGWTFLLGIGVAAIVVLYPVGHDGWIALAIGVVLAGLGLKMLRGRKLGPPPTPRCRWLRFTHGLGRWLAVLLLTTWIVLLGWEKICLGGPAPPAKAQADQIRVVTWNLHCGQETGPLWLHFDWARRKHALQSALGAVVPDILCVQEAVAEQVAFLEQLLPRHRRVGVGRDDGREGGEHCAIYFDRNRFEELDSGTFWLEEPIDEPRRSLLSPLNIKRICTWVRLRDRRVDRVLRVYNAHQYLTEEAAWPAAQLIRAQVVKGDPTDAVIVAADFNTGPQAPSRQLFSNAGLTDSAALAGKPIDTPTIQIRGVRLWNIDAILLSAHWRVPQYHIVDLKPDGVFPSDHFGVLADLAWID